jgi:hypothetical protein
LDLVEDPETGVVIPLVARVPHLVFFQSVTPEGDELDIYYEMMFIEGRSQIEKRSLEQILEKSREEQIPTAVFRPVVEPREPRPPPREPREPGVVGERPRRRPPRAPPGEFEFIPADVRRAVEEEALFQKMDNLNLSYDAQARIAEKLRKKKEGEEG